MPSQSDADKTLAFYQEALFKNPNLCYAAVIKDETTGGSQESYIIEAGVYNMQQHMEHKNVLHDNRFSYEKVVPDFLQIPLSDNFLLPEAVDKSKPQISVDIKETKGFIAHSNKSRVRPIGGGLSISNLHFNEAGTLGEIMKLDGNPDFFILSCWHVLYGPGGRDNDDVVQPGVLDGGNPADAIADLYWYKLTGQVDAALARIKPGVSIAPGVRCFGKSGKIINAVVGMRVKKCGRSSEATTGVIRSVNATARISGYPGGVALFYNQILTTNMSQPGDSGALLMIDEPDNDIVGLLIGGNEISESVSNHFSLIFAPVDEKTFNTPHSISPVKEVRFHSFLSQ